MSSSRSIGDTESVLAEVQVSIVGVRVAIWLKEAVLAMPLDSASTGSVLHALLQVLEVGSEFLLLALDFVGEATKPADGIVHEHRSSS